MIDTHKLELPLSRTYFMVPRVFELLKFYCTKKSQSGNRACVACRFGSQFNEANCFYQDLNLRTRMKPSFLSFSGIMASGFSYMCVLVTLVFWNVVT